MAQKLKLKWNVEGDGNSKFYHCILKKKRHNLLKVSEWRINGSPNQIGWNMSLYISIRTST